MMTIMAKFKEIYGAFNKDVTAAISTLSLLKDVHGIDIHPTRNNNSERNDDSLSGTKIITKQAQHENQLIHKGHNSQKNHSMEPNESF